MSDVTVEIRIKDRSVEPIHLTIDGRSMFKLSHVAARRLADNLRIAADRVLHETCDHSCGGFQFEGDIVCRDCRRNLG